MTTISGINNSRYDPCINLVRNNTQSAAQLLPKCLILRPPQLQYGGITEKRRKIHGYQGSLD